MNLGVGELLKSFIRPLLSQREVGRFLNFFQSEINVLPQQYLLLPSFFMCVRAVKVYSVSIRPNETDRNLTKAEGK